ncbi:flagellar assembly protein FliH [Azospirillum sp. YIM DDC1]|uniref:Flagellar assembly protein FliH n=1 Tax=Azospirillum aestuarii TaxID=2802052 RepID=A0ABS1HRA3_9PROT|nr:FliH/SctL family protein [Azospirillum aestuarii]MBK4717359.1 flagellar assembly protein FliH [Azospirillum aestuarii]
MSSVRKFLFDESFDVDAPPRRQLQADDDYFDNIPLPEPEPEPEPELPPEPPPPVFGEADLAAARAAGFAEGETAGKSTGYGKGFVDGNNAGRKDGYEQARVEIEATVQARIANALETVGNGVQHLLNEHYATSAQRADQPVHIAMAIVRKLMPELARRGGLMEVEGLVRACLTDLIDEPRLVVRVTDGMVDAVREHLDQVIAARGFGAKLMVVDDSGLAPGSCRIEWAEGGVERDTAGLLAQIERRMAGLLEAPPG